MMLTAAAVAKLIILYANQPPTVINYPTMARCEAAKRTLLEQAHEGRTIADRVSPQAVYQVKAYCIPG